MEIKIGKLAGFCGGVTNSVNKTNKLLEEHGSMYCLGELVHNKQVVDKLKKHFQYVSLLASDVEGKEIYVSEKNVAVKDSLWQERGFVVRVFNDGIYSEYSFDKITTIKDVYTKIVNAVDISEPLYKAIYVKGNKNKMIAEVIVDVMSSEVDRVFDYNIPSSLDDITVGFRVLVPFGNRKIEGYINFVGLIILFGFMILITIKDITTERATEKQLLQHVTKCIYTENVVFIITK